MRVHEIKIHHSLFPALRAGFKTAEVRRDDRDYRVGDTLMIYPVGDDGSALGEDYCMREVTHKVDGGQYGIEAGYCLLSIK